MQNTSTIEMLEHVNCRRSRAKCKLAPELKQMTGERPANLLRYVLVPKPPLHSEIGHVCRLNACCLLAGWLAGLDASNRGHRDVHQAVRHEQRRACVARLLFLGVWRRGSGVILTGVGAGGEGDMIHVL